MIDHTPRFTVIKATNGFVIEWHSQKALEEYFRRRNSAMSMGYDPAPRTSGMLVALTLEELFDWIDPFLSSENNV